MDKWANLVEISHKEYERAQEKIRARPAPIANEVGVLAKDVVAPVDKDPGIDDEDESVAKCPRRAICKPRRKKSVEGPSTVDDGLVVSDEIKDQLPYPIRGLVEDIGDHYTIKQWSSVTSCPLSEQLTMVYAQGLATAMGTSVVMANLKAGLPELEKRVAHAEEGLKKEKGKCNELSKKLSTANSAQVKAQEEAKADREKIEILMAEQQRLEEALKAEKLVSEEALKMAKAARDEAAKVAENKEEEIAIAVYEATDPKGPLLQVLLMKARLLGYKLAVKYIKAKYPDQDFTFMDDNVVLLEEACTLAASRAQPSNL